MRIGSSRKQVGFSLVLGVFGGVWSAIISFICVPWYVSLLGIESYGLIGFFVTLQAVIGLLDLGVGATINREVARSSTLGDFGYARRLLRSLELVYAVAAILIGATIAVAAPLISTFWLNATRLPPGDTHSALSLMGLVLALRWPVGLYYGSLFGLQRAEVSYRIIAVMTTLANVGAVLVLLYVQQTLLAYFVWQVASAFVTLLWARRQAWRQLGGRDGATFDKALLRNVLVQSVAMSGVAISGVMLTQIDKLVVSASISLEDFGRYSLAVVLASGLSVLFIPTFNLIYPRLSALAAAGRSAEQVTFYRLGTRLFLSVLFPIALSAFFYAYDLLALWTGDAALAAQTAPIAGLLCLGSAINGVMHFPYALQLARGRTKLAFLTNCLLLMIALPITILLVEHYGALGGALAWLAVNASYAVIGLTVTHLYLLPGVLRQWLLWDVAPALAVAAAIVVGGRYMASMVSPDHFIQLTVAAAGSLAATVIMLALYRDARLLLGELWGSAASRFRQVPETSH